LQNFERVFLSGVQYYRASEWLSAVAAMEEALTDYFSAEEECRLACEKPFDMGWYPEYVLAISSKSESILHIQYNCSSLKCKVSSYFKRDNNASY
jgi:hypothetical protein